MSAETYRAEGFGEGLELDVLAVFSHRSHGGPFSSSEAVQSTRVSPKDTMHEPSA